MFPTNPTSRFASLCIALAGWLAATPAPVTACTICIGFPQKTDADYIIESQCVILAREDPNKAFTFVPVEILKGTFDGEVGLFVDSVTRRRLAANVNRKVVLVQAADDAWRSLGVASAECEAVVRRIVLLSPQWKGETGKLRRIEFFVPLFGHDDPSIYNLAYLEMGRAPYRVIKRLGRVTRRDAIAPILSQPQYVEWRSLAILLLAQSIDAKDRRYISESFRTAERLGLTTNLAAWAAAAIELEGAKAIGFIEGRYFRHPARKKEELDAVVKALSLHGSEGNPQLRDAIIACYNVLLDAHPEMAAQVAADLLAWNRDDLAAQISQIITGDARFDADAQKTIHRYLRMCAHRRKTTSVKN